MIRLVLTALLSTLLISCQTPNSRNNQRIALASAGGALLGGALAPNDERKDVHALYWGAMCGLVTAVTLNALQEQDQTPLVLQKEVDRLKSELDLFQRSKQILVDQGKGTLKGANASANKGPVQWKVYEIDRWSKDGPDRVYHLDKMIELTPIDKKE